MKDNVVLNSINIQPYISLFISTVSNRSKPHPSKSRCIKRMVIMSLHKKKTSDLHTHICKEIDNVPRLRRIDCMQNIDVNM